MEAAIQTVVKVFLKSAKGNDSMGGKDFDNLVKKQLGNVLTDTDSKTALKEMRKGLDENQDGKVSFEEYMTLIGYLATSMSDAKTKEKAEAPKGDGGAPKGDGANSAPAQENNSAAPAAVALVVEQPKLDEGKKVEVALPEPVAAAASAAAGAASAAAGAATGAVSAAAGALSAAATSAAAGAVGALSSVAAAAGVVVEEAEPKESVDGALAAAASLAEGEVKVEAPTS